MATANVLHTVPQALQDRLEVLRLPGYTEQEKVEIAIRHLLPQADRGPRTARRRTSRSLERPSRRSSAVIRARLASATSSEKSPRSAERWRGRWWSTGADFSAAVTPETLSEYLGVPRYHSAKQEEHAEIGMATGLAWTEVGGEILPIEVTLMPGKGALRLTGKLGDVMQESAHAAMSFVRSRAEEYGIKREFNRKLDVHIHVPEGAIPKDGPSAGITMCTALVSALSRVPVRHDVAMTGEITLRGKVLPIGGVKEKLLAAHRFGVTTVDHAAGEREGFAGRSRQRPRNGTRRAGEPYRRGSEDRPPPPDDAGSA